MMAVIADVTDTVKAWGKVWSELDNIVEAKYPRGTRVSFKKFTYWGVPTPVVTGTVMWNNVKANDSSLRIYLKIAVDEQFKPFEMKLVEANEAGVILDLLNAEYDITIID
jgi:hypothetical protein